MQKLPIHLSWSRYIPKLKHAPNLSGGRVKRMGLVVSSMAASSVLLFGFQNCTQTYRAKPASSSTTQLSGNGNGYDGKIYKAASSNLTCADGNQVVTEIRIPNADPDSAYLTRDNCTDVAQPIKIESAQYYLINDRTIKYLSSIMNYTETKCDFMIGSESDLGSFQEGSTYCFANDIELTQPVLQIPQLTKVTIDGKGFRLKNLKVPLSGWFRGMSYSVLMNLIIDSPSFNESSAVEAASGLISGGLYNTTIISVTVVNLPDVQANSTAHSGLLFGYVMTSSLQNVSVQSQNSVSLSGQIYGGVVAATINNVSLSGISVDVANITFNQIGQNGAVAGLIQDWDSYPPTLENFSVIAPNVTVNGDGALFGGIAGSLDVASGLIFTNANVSGNFHLNGALFGAGLFGACSSELIPGSISGANVSVSMDAKLSTTNENARSWGLGVAGICGLSNGSSLITLSDVHVEATLQATSDEGHVYLGGLVAQDRYSGGLNVVDATGLSTITSSGLATFSAGRMKPIIPQSALSIVNSTFEATHNGTPLD